MPHGSPHFPVDTTGGLALSPSPLASGPTAFGGSSVGVTALGITGLGVTGTGMTASGAPAGLPVNGNSPVLHALDKHDSVRTVNGSAANGRAPINGHAVNGHATNGHPTNGHAENGVASNGISARGVKAPHISLPASDAPGPATDTPRPFKLSKRTNTLLGVQIVGCGSYVPDNVITNDELERQYGFQPGWIEQRTGILTRRHAPPEMATSDLCVEAAERCMKAARVNASDVDLLVLGTFTPDYPVPSAACLVQDRLGLDAPAIEVQSACSGFVYALVTAAQYVATGNSKMALVIGGDINSRIVNPYDQKTAPLFGDAAGAVLVTRGEPHQGLACYQIGADGSGASLLNRPLGGTRRPLRAEDIAAGDHFLHMEGRSVFKWAVRALTETIELLLNKTGMSVHDVALYLLHQANQRIIAYAMEQLGIPSSKVFNNLEKYGNTSAGSIPLAMDEAWRAGRIRRGDTLLLCGFGAGLSWGTALFRW